MAKLKKRITAAKGITLCEQYIFDGLTREVILRKIAKVSNSASRTVDTWMKIARPRAEERQREVEAARQREMDNANLEALKDGLKTDLELEVFLCQFAMDGIKVEEMVKGQAIIRNSSPLERIKAIEQIFKKRGSYAPVKNALTNADGKDLDLSKLPVIFK